MSLNRCCNCEFQTFNNENNCMGCNKGGSPYFIIPIRFIDFFMCGWVANCDNYAKLTTTVVQEMTEFNANVYQDALATVISTSKDM